MATLSEDWRRVTALGTAARDLGRVGVHDFSPEHHPPLLASLVQAVGRAEGELVSTRDNNAHYCDGLVAVMTHFPRNSPFPVLISLSCPFPLLITPPS